MADKKQENLDAIKAGVDNKINARASRRNFLKKALFTGVAAATTATVAKKAVSLIPEEDHQRQYLKDVMPGDKVLAQREYVVMSEKEKEELIKVLSENNNKEA